MHQSRAHASLWSLWLGAGLNSQPGPGPAFLLFLKVVKAAAVGFAAPLLPLWRTEKALHVLA